MLFGHIFRLYLTIVFKRKFFPTILKDAHITPIFHIGDVSVLTNCRRPISVTPTFAKHFERLLLNQLVEYLENFALLNKKQFGFQSRKSSTDAVLYSIEKIIGNMEYNNDTGAVFLDLAKKFTLSLHEIFLKKAENFNLSQ